jgi:hypothetical protein
MISFPLYIFLIVYLALIFVALIYILFNFYHLFRFGSLEVETVFFSFLFIVILVIIFFCSYQEIIKIDWRQPLFTIVFPDFIREMVSKKIEINLPSEWGNLNLINQSQ